MIEPARAPHRFGTSTALTGLPGSRLGSSAIEACDPDDSSRATRVRFLNTGSHKQEKAMKTLVLANQKGGVGKSAVATLLAQYGVRQGHRVLAINFDHQGNFSSAITQSKRASLSHATADLLMTTARSQMPRNRFVLVPAADPLLGLERQPTVHAPFAHNVRDFLKSVDDQFDVCVIDTHPNPDIRVIAAMATSDFLLSPIQLNQESTDGVRALLNHQRVGFHKIKTLTWAKAEASLNVAYLLHAHTAPPGHNQTAATVSLWASYPG